MKKLITIFFFFIFSSQVFPVKEMGKILWDGNTMEEVQECGNSNANLLEEEAQHKKLWITASSLYFFISSLCSSLHHVQLKEALYKLLLPDLLLQPPNA